jgi:hypothetical protein
MGHFVHALVTTTAVARRAMEGNPELRAFALPQDLAIIPLTESLLDRVGPNEELDAFVAQLSRGGVVAQIETEYFGGLGGQSATAWRDGRVVFGPAKGESGPINGALKLLGVRCTNTDEFDAVGLGRVRQTEDWIQKGQAI